MNPDPGGWATFVDPPSAELQQFPLACGRAAERQAREESLEGDPLAFKVAAQAVGAIAVGLDKPLCLTNLVAIGAPIAELQRITRIPFVAEGDVEKVAAEFSKKYRWLIGLIAERITNYGGRVELL
jgi:hypothetical protein